MGYKNVIVSHVQLFVTSWTNHEIFQARILEWAAVPFSRSSSWPRDGSHGSYVSCIGWRVLNHKCHLGSSIQHVNINRLSSWLRNQVAWPSLNPSFTISNSVTLTSYFLCNPLSKLTRCDVNNTSLKWLSCRMRNYCLVLVDMQPCQYCYHRRPISYYQFHVDGHIEWLQFFFSYIMH